jgi:hypothetical protein
MSLALPRTNHESDNAATTGDVGAEMTLAVYAYSVISRTCAHKRDLTVVAASVNAVLELAALRSVCGDNGPVLAGGVDDGAGVLLPPPKLTSVPMLDKKRVAAFLSRRDTRTRSTRRERNSRFALLHTREDGPWERCAGVVGVLSEPLASGVDDGQTQHDERHHGATSARLDLVVRRVNNCARSMHRSATTSITAMQPTHLTCEQRVSLQSRNFQSQQIWPPVLRTLVNLPRQLNNNKKQSVLQMRKRTWFRVFGSEPSLIRHESEDCNWFVLLVKHTVQAV